MKKFILTILSLLIFASIAGAQSATVTATTYGTTNTILVRCEWTADAGGAVSFTLDETTEGADLLSVLRGRFCGIAVTAPGTVAPTADYDITIEYAITASIDYSIFGTGLADRSATVAQSAPPLIATYAGGFPITSTWTVSITAAGNGGQGVIDLIFR
jgi:hypothetical protein